MHIITLSVHKDEACHGLYEGDVKGRWTQQVFVVRGDTIAKFETDYGPTENFDHIQPIRLISLGDDTVGEMMVEAEKNRHDDYWAKRREEMLAGSTLIADILHQKEEADQQRRNRSVMGPYISVGRNLYSQAAVKEGKRDNRA